MGSGARFMSTQTPLDLKKCYAILLAGGQSSRMGQDKAYLKLHGKNLFHYQIETLKSAIPIGNILVSGDRRGDLLYGSMSVLDELQSCGPLAGVHVCLKKILEKNQNAEIQILVIPVDMPFVTQKEVLNLLNNKTSGIDLVYFQNFEMPFVIKKVEAFYNQLQQMTEDFKIRNIKSEYSFRNLFSKLKTLEIKASESEKNNTFKNLNTMEDWYEALRSSSNSSPG